MVCKNCKRQIDDDSIFCKWCGEKQIRERRKKAGVKVPKPKQLADGRWTAQIMVDGHRHNVYGNTAAEYETNARAFKQGLIKAKNRPDDITVAQAIDKYLDSKKNRLKTRSREQYEYIRDKRFQGLMSMKIGDVDSSAIDAAIEAELDKPSRKGGTVKPKTVIDAYALVATVLRKYVKDIDIDVTLPELQQSFITILPPEDIYPAIKGTDIELPCLLAMWLGMSMSEIRGLTKSKSVRGDKLYIVETVVDTNNGPLRKDGGKEEKRPRVYDIPPYLKTLIDAVDGDVIEPRSGHAVYMRFQQELKNAGLPRMKFHALRHINASVMAEEMIPTVVAQERGGWKTDSTMKKVYTHTFTEGRVAADKKMDDRFNKIVGFNGEITTELLSQDKK